MVFIVLWGFFCTSSNMYLGYIHLTLWSSGFSWVGTLVHEPNKPIHTHVLFSDWQLVYDGFYGVWSTFTQIFSFDPHYSCVMRDRSRSLWNIKWCTSRSQILNGIWKSKWRLLAISGALSSTPYSWSSFFPPLYWDITDI